MEQMKKAKWILVATDLVLSMVLVWRKFKAVKNGVQATADMGHNWERKHPWDHQR